MLNIVLPVEEVARQNLNPAAAGCTALLRARHVVSVEFITDQYRIFRSSPEASCNTYHGQNSRS